MHLIPANVSSRPLVEPGKSVLKLCYFDLVRLGAGERHGYSAPGCETLCVVLSGKVDMEVDGKTFANVGGRADVWSGPADSVYCGTALEVTLRGLGSGAEVAVAGGVCPDAHEAFRIRPEDVDMVDVGSVATHSRRRIFHILGQGAAGRAGRLLVSELYADPGCRSGSPPHKHDTERPPDETAFEEIYHYRFRPESGFGAQICYESESAGPHAVMTRHGDTFLIERGYHPTVTSPGCEGYIFTILVGHHQRSLVQFFDPRHRHMMDKIPGIQGMRDKFK